MTTESITGKGLNAIMDGYSRIFKIKGKEDEFFYEAALKEAMQISCTKSDLGIICQEMEKAYSTWLKYGLDYLPEYCKEGLYISALINSNLKEDETLPLKLHSELGYIGYKHRAGTLVIEGNTRIGTGMWMSGGKIIVKGNAGSYTASGMAGGELIVEGNAGQWAGFMMRSGKLAVKGDAGRFAAFGMEGGILVVEGKIQGGLNHPARGEVWEAGKKIYPAR